jgi:hypothetical protein
VAAAPGRRGPRPSRRRCARPDLVIPVGRGDDDALVVGGRDLALEAGVEARGLEVVQQLLGLVLEAQDDDVGADLDVREQRALLADALDDRVAVRAGGGVADRCPHPLLQHRAHRVLDPLGLLVDLVPGDVEDVGEEALDHPVAADDVAGVLAARLGEGERFVLFPLDVAVVDQPADHLVHGRRRELHRAGDVGARHRQPGLLQPEHDLQVLLLRDGRILRRQKLSFRPGVPSARKRPPRRSRRPCCLQ